MVTSARQGHSKRKDATAERRRAILNAARMVFARQGYAATVVEDIAKHADIGKGTLYLYFPSKEQIYLAALLEDAHRLESDSRNAMAAAATWQQKLRAFIEVRLRYFDDHRDFVRIYLTEFRSMCLQQRPVHAELHHVLDAGESQLAQMFAAAAAHGEIREIDPELAAATVTEVTRGLMERRLRRGDRADFADRDFALDFLCRALDRERSGDAARSSR